MHVSADISFMEGYIDVLFILYNIAPWVGQSNVLGTLTPKHVHLLPAVFFQFHLKEKWGMNKSKGVLSQERSKIEVKLLLSANRKACRVA